MTTIAAVMPNSRTLHATQVRTINPRESRERNSKDESEIVAISYDLLNQFYGGAFGLIRRNSRGQVRRALELKTTNHVVDHRKKESKHHRERRAYKAHKAVQYLFDQGLLKMEQVAGGRQPIWEPVVTEKGRLELCKSNHPSNRRFKRTYVRKAS